MSQVEQIIKTACEQHARCELTLQELEALHQRYGITGMFIDGDKLQTSINTMSVSEKF